jgi:hypothetical protein
MITFLPPEKLYVPEHGDILWGAPSDWAAPPEGEEPCPMRKAGLLLNVLDGDEFEKNQILKLGMINPNTLKAARACGIITEVFDWAYHQDPYLPWNTWGMVPIAILSDNIEKYRSTLQEMAVAFLDLVMDHKWNKEMHKEDLLKIGEITEHLMGSGYSHGCSVNDGHRRRVYAKLKMSNGDWLYVAVWEWYNK